MTVSALAILVSITGWYPTQLSAAGLTFTEADRVTFLWLLAATVLYLLVSFISYVWPEQLYANAAVWVWTETAKDEPGIPWQIALPSFMARYAVDLITPLPEVRSRTSVLFSRQPNYVRRTHATKPNQIWVGDVTYLAVGGRWCGTTTPDACIRRWGINRPLTMNGKPRRTSLPTEPREDPGR